MWLAVLFIIAGVLSRLIPHLPNFAPLVAMALFAGTYLKHRYAWLLPLAVYFLSDLILGLHSTLFFTWGSVLLIYFLGRTLSKKKTIANTLLFTLAASVLFFLITNFGVWAMGWYQPNLAGLITSYLNALPFFRTALVADFFYVAVFFGSYEFFAQKIKLAQKVT